MLPILIPSVLIGLRYYEYTLGFLGMAFTSVLIETAGKGNEERRRGRGVGRRRRKWRSLWKVS